ncbi:GspH/FimT family pseudopilin [Acinetobacter sp. AND/436]|uniref:GspH/FimT family pseudopilin n=1 Tax=Acinetobacter sp. AND/436 TaxID=3414736 RepID=UPI003C2FE9BA
MRKSQGFTLIELMVTIAVLAIVAMMAAPSFQAIVSNQQLQRSTETLLQEIKVARTEAILNRQTVSLNLNSSTTNTYGNVNWLPAGDVRLKTPANNRLTFNPSGVLTSNFKEIELCKTAGRSASKKITLTTFGQIEKIEEGSCT